MADILPFFRRSFRVLLPVLFAVLCGAHAGDSASELRKINALLEGVKTSQVTFIRNGREYTSQEAYAHLRKKMKSAENSWFAPPKDAWTARLFIDKVAARSSLSGKPYSVRLKEGKVIEARAWLTDMLREIEASSSSPDQGGAPFTE